MARIETDPNYTTPTFSRATAATDLFKKEDVQNLAAAVSTHDHASGKGALITGPINGSQIVDGTITSAKIQDNTIQGADILDGSIGTGELADGAVTGIATGGLTSGASTTSTVAVAIPGVATNTFTSTGPRSVLVSGTLTVQFNAITQNCNLFLYRDGTQLAVVAIAQSASATQMLNLHFLYQDLACPVGVHNYSLYWSTSAGTIALVGATWSTMNAIELRR